MPSMRLLLSGVMLFSVAGLALAQNAAMVRTGRAAYGDWHSDAPGIMRKITAADLAAPLETPSTANRSRVVPKPAGAALKAPEGFTVEPFGETGCHLVRG